MGLKTSMCPHFKATASDLIKIASVLLQTTRKQETTFVTQKVPSDVCTVLVLR